MGQQAPQELALPRAPPLALLARPLALDLALTEGPALAPAHAPLPPPLASA